MKGGLCAEKVVGGGPSEMEVADVQSFPSQLGFPAWAPSMSVPLGLFHSSASDRVPRLYVPVDGMRLGPFNTSPAAP